MKNFERTCWQGKEMGFDGRTLIHPSTIDAANEIYSPSEEEIDFAKRVVEAHAKATASGKGVTTVDGQLVENLHVEMAKDILAKVASV